MDFVYQIQTANQLTEPTAIFVVGFVLGLMFAGLLCIILK